MDKKANVGAGPADSGDKGVARGGSLAPDMKKPLNSPVWDGFDVCVTNNEYTICRHGQAKIKQCEGKSSLTKHRKRFAAVF